MHFDLTDLRLFLHVAEAGSITAGALSLVRLEDSWADRRLLVVVRRLDGLPVHARRLVEHLAAAR